MKRPYRYVMGKLEKLVWDTQVVYTKYQGHRPLGERKRSCTFFRHGRQDMAHTYTTHKGKYG